MLAVYLIVCGEVQSSKALRKSKKIAHTSFPASRRFRILWVVLSSAVTVDFLAWNPHWEVDNGLWASTCSAMMPCTCLSNSLLRIDKSEIGL